MQAKLVHQHLQGVGTWVDWSDTTDGFHFGDPQMEIRGIAVAWKPYWWALRQAVELRFGW